MKTLYYDCFSGISGDMNLGAMVDLGVNEDYLKTELSKLQITGYELSISRAIKKGIEGTRVEVKLSANKNGEKKASSRFKMASSTLPQNHSAILKEIHEDRNFKNIQEIINLSDLSDKVKHLSIEMFRRVAVAEGKIHGRPIEEVHFHEVGAVDSIVDIVGAAICIDYLKPDKIVSSPLQLGGGFVKCAHGTFPVPAPATAEILKGIPTRMGAVNSETTTPTGAAILATLCDSFTSQTDFTVQKIGYGIGFKDFEIPNVLRVMWVDDILKPNDYESEETRLIECNIDDMSAELFENVMDKLLQTGADDVFFESILMKKNRPALKISVLTKPTLLDSVLKIIFTETTTLGVRIIKGEKKMMLRKFESIQTLWGPVTIKYGLLNGKKIKAKPEYNDCLLIAQKNNLPLNLVYSSISKQITLD